MNRIEMSLKVKTYDEKKKVQLLMKCEKTENRRRKQRKTHAYGYKSFVYANEC